MDKRLRDNRDALFTLLIAMGSAHGDEPHIARNQQIRRSRHGDIGDTERDQRQTPPAPAAHPNAQPKPAERDQREREA